MQVRDLQTLRLASQMLASVFGGQNKTTAREVPRWAQVFGGENKTPLGASARWAQVFGGQNKTRCAREGLRPDTARRQVCDLRVT
jgi:hypothetical protein